MTTLPGLLSRVSAGISRREFLQVGGLGMAGLALPELFRARAQASNPTPTLRDMGKAKSCILLFMGGGPPQMDTFDLKPEAPAEVRGELPAHAHDSEPVGIPVTDQADRDDGGDQAVLDGGGAGLALRKAGEQVLHDWILHTFD